MSIFEEMKELLGEATSSAKVYTVRNNKLMLPDLTLKPGDSITVTARGAMFGVIRKSDGARSSMSSKFLKKMIAHADLVAQE